MKPATDRGGVATLASILLPGAPGARPEPEADRCPECGGWRVWTGWWPPTGARECSYCLRFGLCDGAGI